MIQENESAVNRGIGRSPDIYHRRGVNPPQCLTISTFSKKIMCPNVTFMCFVGSVDGVQVIISALGSKWTSGKHKM